MKEKLYEIPMNDAVDADDECPFCFIERKTEQEILDFVLGSCASYMEKDMREATDKAGFCRAHQKKMFDYGNALGNGWMLKTYYKNLIQDMEQAFNGFTPKKASMLDRLAGKNRKQEEENLIERWVSGKESTCYICDRLAETYERYIATFFHLYKKDEGFCKKIESGKGFCLHHFGELCGGAGRYLDEAGRMKFYSMLFDVMKRSMKRLSEDVDWFIEKYDYLNRDADWKQSKDAIQRGMQKIRGGYPADPPYKMK